MATVSIAFIGLSDFNGTQVARSDGTTTESKTSSGSSSASTNAATSAHKAVRISTTGAIWVAISASPTASAGTEFLLPAGATEYFAVVAGDKVAIIDAA